MAQLFASDTFLAVRLVSGQEYQIREVLLFDRQCITDATTLKSQAINKLGGFRTGIGGIGDLGFVLTTSVVNGLIEGMISAKAKQEGMEMLDAAEKLLAKSRLACQYVAPCSIYNVQFAMPKLWWAMLDAKQENAVYVHNGDPFVTARMNDGSQVSIIWDKVETYQLVSVS